MKKKKKIKKYVRRSFWFYFRKFLAVIVVVMSVFSLRMYTYISNRQLNQFPYSFTYNDSKYSTLHDKYNINSDFSREQTYTNIFNSTGLSTFSSLKEIEYLEKVIKKIEESEDINMLTNMKLQSVAEKVSSYYSYPNSAYIFMIDKTVYNEKTMRYEWENVTTITSEGKNYIEYRVDYESPLESYECMTEIPSVFNSYNNISNQTFYELFKNYFFPKFEFTEIIADDVYINGNKAWLGHYRIEKSITHLNERKIVSTEEFDDTPSDKENYKHISLPGRIEVFSYNQPDDLYTLNHLKDIESKALRRCQNDKEIPLSDIIKSELTAGNYTTANNRSTKYGSLSTGEKIVFDNSLDLHNCLFYYEDYFVEGNDMHTIKYKEYDEYNSTIKMNVDELYTKDRKQYYENSNKYQISMIAIAEKDKNALWKDKYWTAEIIYWDIIISFPYLLLSLFISIYLNSNNRKKYYMQEENEYRKTLTNTLAHDLKTPLTAMRGYAENLIESTNPEKSDYYMNKILSNTEYMNKIIQDILELSKSEVNNTPTNITIIDIAEILKEKLNENKDELSAKGIRLNIADCSFIAQANETMINQIAVNLTENILKYTKDNGQVWLETGSKSLILKNTCASDIKHGNELLEPFVKGDESRTNQMGSGLGLSLVHNLAEKNNLKINVSADDGIFVVEILEKHN